MRVAPKAFDAFTITSIDWFEAGRAGLTLDNGDKVVLGSLAMISRLSVGDIYVPETAAVHEAVKFALDFSVIAEPPLTVKDTGNTP